MQVDCPDGKIHKQIDHILIDTRWHWSILDVRYFRGADCDTDHYLVVPKVRERLAVSKQAAQNFDEERFNIRKLSELEFRKVYQIQFTNRSAALEKFSYSKGICSAWENITENINTSAKQSLVLYELKQLKPV